MASDWADVAAAYDTSFARLCAGTIPSLVSAVSALGARPVVLDVGTGTGNVAAALRDAGHLVTGVDAEPSMVEFARRRHPGIRFERSALPELAFADDSFDAAVANFVLNHTLKPRDAAHELARVTRPGGLVVATIWPSEPVSPMNRLFSEVVERAGAVPLTGTRLPPEDDFPRSEHGFADLLNAAGLRDVRSQSVAWTFPISPDDLWLAVEGGIASIGMTYRAQDASTRVAMKQAFDEVTGSADGRTLELPSTAVLACGIAGDPRLTPTSPGRR